jgi:hypothetical protein
MKHYCLSETNRNNEETKIQRNSTVAGYRSFSSKTSKQNFPTSMVAAELGKRQKDQTCCSCSAAHKKLE